MTVPRDSVHGDIIRQRNRGFLRAARNAAITVSCIALVTVTGRWPWLLFLAGSQAMALLVNAILALKAQTALNIYQRNLGDIRQGPAMKTVARILAYLAGSTGTGLLFVVLCLWLARNPYAPWYEVTGAVLGAFACLSGTGAFIALGAIASTDAQMGRWAPPHKKSWWRG